MTKLDHESNRDGQTAVLIVGAGVVGRIAAIKLARAGIQVHIIEKLSETSNAPRACGYFGAAQILLDELELYSLIREEGFMTRGICWRGLPQGDGSHKSFGPLVGVQPLCAPMTRILVLYQGFSTSHKAN